MSGEGGYPLARLEGCTRAVALAALFFGLFLPDTAPVAASEEPPLFIQITEPANNSLLSSANLIVSGLTNPGADVTINGEPAINDNGSFIKGLYFLEGPGAIHIRVVRGNDSLVRVLNLTVDATAPRIEILEPVAYHSRTNRTVTCRVRSEPYINLTLNGFPMRYEGNGIYYGEAPMLDYPYWIRVYATDAAGNTASESIGAFVDPPLSPIKQPSLLDRFQPWMVPTLIIGISLVAAGLVMRWKRR